MSTVAILLLAGFVQSKSNFGGGGGEWREVRICPRRTVHFFRGFLFGVGILFMILGWIPAHTEDWHNLGAIIFLFGASGIIVIISAYVEDLFVRFAAYWERSHRR